jgi:hypothetical protein
MPEGINRTKTGINEMNLELENKLIEIVSDRIVDEMKGGPGSGIRGHRTARDTEDKTIIFHGTKESVLKNILENGLKANQDMKLNVQGEGYVSGIYCSSSRDVAEMYASKTWQNFTTPKGLSVIIEFSVPDKIKLQRDPLEGETSLFYKGDIPKEYIKSYSILGEDNKWTNHKIKQLTESLFVSIFIDGEEQKSLGLSTIFKGGPDSGNYGHAGRPGQVGGSGSGGQGATHSLFDKSDQEIRDIESKQETTNKDVFQRQLDVKDFGPGGKYAQAGRDHYGFDSTDSLTPDLINDMVEGSNNKVGKGNSSDLLNRVNKLESQNALYEKLKDDKDFNELSNNMQPEFGERNTKYSLPSAPNTEKEYNEWGKKKSLRELVDQWASTSGDTDPKAVAMQIAANELFEEGMLDHIRNPYKYKGIDPVQEVRFAEHLSSELKFNPGRKAFLQAQYDATQDYLSKNNIKEVIVYRGHEGKRSKLEGGNDVEVNMQPLSSFSLNPKIARDFTASSDGGYPTPIHPSVVASIVPARRIFSLPNTGIGCTSEKEVVVLGGKMKATVIAGVLKLDEVFSAQTVRSAIDIRSYLTPKNFSSYPALGALLEGKAAKKKLPNLDEDLENADWTKMTWDLPEYGSVKFNQFFESSGMTLTKFKELPVYKWKDRLPPPPNTSKNLSNLGQTGFYSKPLGLGRTFQQGLIVEGIKHLPGKHDQMTHGRGGHSGELSGIVNRIRNLGGMNENSSEYTNKVNKILEDIGASENNDIGRVYRRDNPMVLEAIARMPKLDEGTSIRWETFTVDDMKDELAMIEREEGVFEGSYQKRAAAITTYHGDGSSDIKLHTLSDNEWFSGLNLPNSMHHKAGTMVSVAAHEYAHVIDGYNNKYSDTVLWKDIWAKDKKVSLYATLNAKEGFADSMALMGIRPKYFQKKHPEMYAVISELTNWDPVGANKKSLEKESMFQELPKWTVVNIGNKQILLLEEKKTKSLGLSSIMLKGGHGSGIKGHRTFREDVAPQMKKNLTEIAEGKANRTEVSGSISTTNIKDVVKNMRNEADLYNSYLASDTAVKMRDFISSYENILHEGTRSGEFKNIQAKDLDDFGIDAVQKMVHQEIESNRQQFTDHGIRHIEGNTQRQLELMDQMGTPTAMDRLSALTIMSNHDMGYTTAAVRAGDMKALGQHKTASGEMFDDQKSTWNEGKIFSEQQFSRISTAIKTHDSTEMSKDNLLTSTRLSDNLALFAKEKLPSMFKYVKGGNIELIKMGEAAKKNDSSAFELARKSLNAKIDASALNVNLKRDLKAGTSSITNMTPKFTLGVLAGEIGSIKKNKDGKVEVSIQHNAYDSFLQGHFDMGQKQTKKLLEDYGHKDFTKTEYDIGGVLRLKVMGVRTKKEVGLDLFFKGGPGSGNYSGPTLEQIAAYEARELKSQGKIFLQSEMKGCI